MTPFWLWVGIGCAFSALSGFSIVRYGVPGLRALAVPGAGHAPARAQQASSVVASPPAVEHEPLPVGEVVRIAVPPPRPAGAKKRRPAVARAAAPTTARPEADKLELWARQVRDGRRTFSLATDGCRVTWDRRCKHGHPSWLVHLGLLTPREMPARQRPR